MRTHVHVLKFETMFTDNATEDCGIRSVKIYFCLYFLSFSQSMPDFQSCFGKKKIY